MTTSGSESGSTIWIQTEQTYGEHTPPTIGPNQVLAFDVVLLEIVKPSDK